MSSRLRLYTVRISLLGAVFHLRNLFEPYMPETQKENSKMLNLQKETILLFYGVHYRSTSSCRIRAAFVAIRLRAALTRRLKKRQNGERTTIFFMDFSWRAGGRRESRAKRLQGTLNLQRVGRKKKAATKSHACQHRYDRRFGKTHQSSSQPLFSASASTSSQAESRRSRWGWSLCHVMEGSRPNLWLLLEAKICRRWCS